jgi:FKBP-type peptidyl-prolyl cis-trans isomerase (trigger factor)
MKPERQYFHTIYGWILGVLCIFWLTAVGCEDRGAQLPAVSLVRVNDRSITVDEFNRRFDAESAEFSVSEKIDPVVEKEMKLRLLQQLTEELILLERADELNLVISDRELEMAIKKIRSDYPEGEFEKTLVEQAIVYGEWKDQLRRRLLKEKVVRKDLESSIELTPEEVAASYEANFPARGVGEDQRLNDTAADEKVIKLVRRQKAQDAYQAWLLDLKVRYDVEINATTWERLIGS